MPDNGDPNLLLKGSRSLSGFFCFQSKKVDRILMCHTGMKPLEGLRHSKNFNTANGTTLEIDESSYGVLMLSINNIAGFLLASPRRRPTTVILKPLRGYSGI